MFRPDTDFIKFLSIKHLVFGLNSLFFGTITSVFSSREDGKATDYGLAGRGKGVRFPEVESDISLIHSVQTGSEDPSSLVYIRHQGHFPRG
jgi:hypothetical protein